MDKILDMSMDCLDVAKFWMHVNIIPSSTPFNLRYGNCWEWQGALFSSGYGHFIRRKKSYRAHRISYYLYAGELSSEKVICHRCDNKKCVNPKHLYEGSHKDNINDMLKKGQRSSEKSKKRNKNKYFGVYKRKKGSWRAILSHNYKNTNIGSFSSEIDAAQAYDKAAIEFNKDRPLEHHKPLNFPL